MPSKLHRSSIKKGKKNTLLLSQRDVRRDATSSLIPHCEKTHASAKRNYYHHHPLIYFLDPRFDFLSLFPPSSEIKKNKGKIRRSPRMISKVGNPRPVEVSADSTTTATTTTRRSSTGYRCRRTRGGRLTKAVWVYL